MSISAKIETSIEHWTTLWKERMRGFLISIMQLGLEAFMHVVGKAGAKILKPWIETMEATGEVPEELKPIFKELKEPTTQWQGMVAMMAGGSVMGGAIGTLGDVMFGSMARAMMKKVTNKIMDVVPLITAARRVGKDEIDYYGHMAEIGFDKTWADWWWTATDYRLDPATVVTAWRRDKILYEKLFKDLEDQGWDLDRIEALKLATQAFPSLRDVIEFYAHEVFEPDMVKKYGLEEETPPYEGTLFEKLGVDKEVAKQFWINHWIHPSLGSVYDMLHRGILTADKEMPSEPETLEELEARHAEGTTELDWYYRLVETPPFWRRRLTALSWALPNRIETRMMARYGLVDRKWLVWHLGKIGLHPDYREIAADFMLAMGIRMDIAARYSKGWLTADEVKSEIATFGMSEDINDRLYKWIVKNVGPEKVEEERSLTKTEIYAGVKKGVISWDEGIELLMDLGYSREDAEYILEVRVGALAGSPESFMEFKHLTQGYRRAQGMEYKIPPPELIEAGKALREAEAARKEAIDKGIKAEKLTPYEKAVSDTTYRYRQLLIKWKEEQKAT